MTTRAETSAEHRPLPIIAIDGPSGAGKSTVGKHVARHLSFRYIDTGAIYRALALQARERGVDWLDEEGLDLLARDLPLTFEWKGGENRVHLAGVDRTEEIRSEEMGMGASRVSSLPSVRACLLALQRRMGERGGIVMDGRDIGTVVFPDAELKFFLTADSSERAMRRYNELAAKGQGLPLDQIADDLNRRDRQDTQRAVAPLRQAEDALLVDSSGLSIDEVVAQVVAQVEAYQAGFRRKTSETPDENAGKNQPSIRENI